MSISDEAILIWVFSAMGLYLYPAITRDSLSELNNTNAAGITTASKVSNIFIICYGVVLSFASLATLFSYVRRKLSKTVSLNRAADANCLEDLEGVEVLLLGSEVLYFSFGSLLANAIGMLWDLTSVRERTSEIDTKIASWIYGIVLYAGILGFIGVVCSYGCQRVRANIAETTLPKSVIDDRSSSPLLPRKA